MQELLKQKPEEILKAETPPAYLWRYFLYSSGIAAPVWVARLMRHLERVSDANNKVKLSDYKGNLLKALDSKTLPFQRLCQGMSVIAPDGFEFEFSCKVGDKTYKKMVTIGHTYKEERGVILKEIWNEVLNLDEERKKSWTNDCRLYAEKKHATNKKGKKNNSFTNNLKTAMGRKHLTWNSFHTCISILKVEKPTIRLKAEKTDISVSFELM